MNDARIMQIAVFWASIIFLIKLPDAFCSNPYIKETSPYKNYHRFVPHIYKVAMGEILGWNKNDENWYFSIFLHIIMIICSGCILESPRRGDSDKHQQHMILWRTVSKETTQLRSCLL